MSPGRSHRPGLLLCLPPGNYIAPTARPTPPAASTFVDRDFPALGRDTVYYARAFEAPTPTVNGQQPRCSADAPGECTEVALCADTGDCLSSYAHRAWSSPIYVDYPR